MRRTILFLTVMTSPLVGQTQLDLHTQIKAATKAVKTGSVFPSSCIVGDLFLKTDAPQGANLYGCIATNLWTQQSGQGSSLTVHSDGAFAGVENTLNFVSGNGVLKVITDTGSRIDVANMIDTAVVQTHANTQSGRDLFCESASGSGSAYTCSLSPVLNQLTKGMVLTWKPDVTAAGGATTLAVNGLTPAAITLEDGAANPTAAEVRAGQVRQLWYDGAAFRILSSAALLANAAIAKPVCSAQMRGRIWFTAGATGTKDDVSICAKDGSDQFAWRLLY